MRITSKIGRKAAAVDIPTCVHHWVGIDRLSRVNGLLGESRWCVEHTAGNCSAPPLPPPPPPVIGLADYHNHQFAHLGFEGTLHSHDINPSIAACRPPLPSNSTSFRLVDLVRDGLFYYATEQSTKSTCFPTATNLAGQQVDTLSLKRAWEYGLRLLVMHALNSEFLCEVADLANGTCQSDSSAIEAQLRAALALQLRIDTEAGGPGRGWYRIVLTPGEAREVITAGKLAVILGVEASNAYGSCALVTAGSIEGIRDPLGRRNNETKWSVNCGGLVEGMEAPLAAALMEHYYDLGARHFYPIPRRPCHMANSDVPATMTATFPSQVSNGCQYGAHHSSYVLEHRRGQ